MTVTHADDACTGKVTWSNAVRSLRRTLVIWMREARQKTEGASPGKLGKYPVDVVRSDEEKAIT